MNELTKRIITSIPLFIILYFAINNLIVLSLVLVILVYLLLVEFYNILNKIFIINKLFHLIFIIIILIYLIYFSLSIYIYLNSDLANNKIIFLFLVSITISTDIGGYLFGRLFKGKKLTKISPNKTYSGLFGSLFLSALVSYSFFRNLDLNINYFLITIILSLISQFGDLAISFLKRKAKIKDTGSSLPGHGGLLDRIDGILFALPIGLILVNI